MLQRILGSPEPVEPKLESSATVSLMTNFQASKPGKRIVCSDQRHTFSATTNKKETYQQFIDEIEDFVFSISKAAMVPDCHIMGFSLDLEISYQDGGKKIYRTWKSSHKNLEDTLQQLQKLRREEFELYKVPLLTMYKRSKDMFQSVLELEMKNDKFVDTKKETINEPTTKKHKPNSYHIS